MVWRVVWHVVCGGCLCSVGCWALLKGAALHYWCSVFHPCSCRTRGPQLTALDALAFMLQILLVWLAYFMVRACDSFGLLALACLRVGRGV